MWRILSHKRWSLKPVTVKSAQAFSLMLFITNQNTCLTLLAISFNLLFAAAQQEATSSYTGMRVKNPTGNLKVLLSREKCTKSQYQELRAKAKGDWLWKTIHLRKHTLFHQSWPLKKYIWQKHATVVAERWEWGSSWIHNKQNYSTDPKGHNGTNPNILVWKKWSNASYARERMLYSLGLNC